MISIILFVSDWVAPWVFRNPEATGRFSSSPPSFRSSRSCSNAAMPTMSRSASGSVSHMAIAMLYTRMLCQ